MAERSRVLAVLLAISALVVPLAGAAVYYDIDGSGTAGFDWPFPALGAASMSDIIGPTLLVGALALGLLAARRAAGGRASSAVVVLLIAAAGLQAVGFVGFVYELVRPDSGFFMASAASNGLVVTASKWATVARMVVQVVVCLVVAVYAGRLLTEKDRGTADA